MELAENRLGSDRAGERARGSPSDSVGNNEDERRCMNGNEGGRARRRNVARLQVRNQKGILIVVPYQADIRDPKNFCNQFWLEMSEVVRSREEERPGVRQRY
jgi:hypothetical protein